MAEINVLTFDDSPVTLAADKTIAELEKIDKKALGTSANLTEMLMDLKNMSAAIEVEIGKANSELAKNSTIVNNNAKVLSGWRGMMQGAGASLREKVVQLKEYAVGLAKSSGSLIQQGAAAEKAAIGQRALNLVMRLNPIGLVISALTVLIGLLRNFQPVIDKVSQLTSAAGAVFTSVAKSLVDFGSGVKSFLGGNYKEGFGQMAGAISGMGAAAGTAAVQAYNLEKALQGLRDSQIASRLEAFKQKTAIEELKAAGEDETLSVRRKMAALREAQGVSTQYYKREKEFAEEGLKYARETYELSKKNNDDLQTFQDAEIHRDEVLAEMRKNNFEIEKSIREAQKQNREEAKKAADDEAKRLLEFEKLKIDVMREGMERELAQEDFRIMEILKKTKAANDEITRLNKSRGKDEQITLISVEQALEQHELNKRDIKLKYFLADLALKNADIEADRESLERGYAELVAFDEKNEEDRLKRLMAHREGLEVLAQIDAESFESAQLALRKAFFASRRNAEEIKEFEEKLKKEKEIFDLTQHKEQLERTLKFGTELTGAQKTLIRKQIENIKETIDQYGNNEAFSWAKLFGLTEGQLEAVKKGADVILENVNRILDGRIAAAQKERELAEEKVRNAEDFLNKEKEQGLKGNASNIKLAEERLAVEKSSRDKALKEEEKAQRAKLILDTGTQASSLITASANIYKSLSPIPFVGIPLAIGLIATMFAAFGAAKASAFKAIQSPKFRHGRQLKGPTHEEDGIPVVMDGKQVAEAEGDEWFINAKASREHSKFLGRVNSGEASGVDLNHVFDQFKARRPEGHLHRHGQLSIDASKRSRQQENKYVTAEQFAAEMGDLKAEIKKKPYFLPTEKGWKSVEYHGESVYEIEYRKKD